MVKNLPRSLPSTAAWLAVFLPALFYFVTTRMNHAGLAMGDRSSLGTVETRMIHLTSPDYCKKVSQYLYLSSSCDHTSRDYTLKYALNVVQDSGLGHVVSTIWKHDSELGRGYLLMSDAAGQGRIWRWEVGGGPIAIGKTLYLDQAGCRSGFYHNCSVTQKLVGSGGLGIDFSGRSHGQEGRLVVAEWGEGRIARLEENGARTPLVIQVLDVCDSLTESGNNVSSTMILRRLEQPTSVLFTPFGDMLLIDYNTRCQQPVLFQLRGAVHTDPLQSLRHSRVAHEWRHVNQSSTGLPHVLFSGPSLSQLGGLAIAPSWESVYATTVHANNVLLMRIPIASRDDELNVAVNSNDDKTTISKYIAVNLSKHFPSVKKEPGNIAVSGTGLVYWALGSVLYLVVPEDDCVLGYLTTSVPMTSITLAENGFLYLTSRTTLMRIRTRDAPVKVPTDLIM